ncbi:hypothetical protein MKX08_004353 [Trichoderma sp. CBMAI-0020]|nr:hypothetical protein MKX08_004353 [Trichoderma sp. CBMAI-0020]
MSDDPSKDHLSTESYMMDDDDDLLYRMVPSKKDNYNNGEDAYKVNEEDSQGTTGFLKRTNGILKHEAFKSARTTYSMMHPGHYSSDGSDFSETSSDVDMNTFQQRPQRTEDRSKAIARHIAIHLQVLMLLTLRFAALRKDDNDLVDDDLKSDDVDIDEENSSSKSNASESLSDIHSRKDVVVEDMDGEDDPGAAKDLGNDLVKDDIPSPDPDFGLENIPRQYDGLLVENDAFLKKVIESGAWQSWQDETRKPIRYDSENYTIGWICTTSTEYAAAQAFLDDVHEGPGYLISGPDYTLGQIGRHNIVLSYAFSITEYGRSSVTEIARKISYNFPNIRFCLLVGIGGGAPSAKHDIRLGDVIASRLNRLSHPLDFVPPRGLPGAAAPLVTAGMLAAQLWRNIAIGRGPILTPHGGWSWLNHDLSSDGTSSTLLPMMHHDALQAAQNKGMPGSDAPARRYYLALGAAFPPHLLYSQNAPPRPMGGSSTTYLIRAEHL